ncbi:hypothetical protein [Pseudidiomarina homiensis]|uniref:Tetratricopeptide repeat protein n=1 Tax=Pseudidiomarina homiensis TaxID=364198 RepID=A0A432XST9_9GAMM|nr:hypothetical protein [Pseudidiomarina homiensis]RUO51770.1 hypothetical protein CWI70_12155 [Pseudidiomarina homiensis]
MKRFFELLAIALACLFMTACVATNTSPSPSIVAGQDSSREVAMRAYAEGDYHLAEGILQRLAAAPHLDPQAPCYLGAIHYRQHAYQAALKRFQECTTQYPERSEVWFNAAASHLRLATELLLTGRSYQINENSSTALTKQYEGLLKALLQLQRAHADEVY